MTISAERRREVEAAVYDPSLPRVESTAEEWPELRHFIHDQAGKYAQANDGVRLMIALEMVRRLDAEFPSLHPAPIKKLSRGSG